MNLKPLSFSRCCGCCRLGKGDQRTGAAIIAQITATPLILGSGWVNQTIIGVDTVCLEVFLCSRCFYCTMRKPNVLLLVVSLRGWCCSRWWLQPDSPASCCVPHLMLFLILIPSRFQMWSGWAPGRLACTQEISPSFLYSSRHNKGASFELPHSQGICMHLIFPTCFSVLLMKIINLVVFLSHLAALQGQDLNKDSL